MKIRIESDGMSTRVTDPEGNEIAGITKILIEPDSPLRAEIFVDAFTADMMGRLVMIDPRDGRVKTVKRIEFEDAPPYSPGAAPLTPEEVEELSRRWLIKYPTQSPTLVERLFRTLGAR